jgi:heparan-alpha-glucosaminide N-acetyltransferase
MTSGLNAPSTRVHSIDIFRGLTMAVMIFVNALSDVHGLPWWTYHAPARLDEMTYVDMVFPFFLFIVGMSMPLSIAQRLKRKASTAALWLHVLLRSIGLIVLGLILANAEKADAARMGMSGSVWALLAIFSAALYLNAYPKWKRFPNYDRVLRAIGLIGVIVLLAIFRRTTHAGTPAWIDFSYPEILGLIGFSYFAVALLYIPTRRWNWAPPLWFALLMGLCIYSTANHQAFPNHVPWYLWPFDNGAMACIIMAGVATTSIFLGKSQKHNHSRAILIAAAFALIAFIAGWMLTPLGISKIRATPTWSFYCIGAAILVFTLLYWICDVKRQTRWADFVKSAGENTLTTYLLPDVWFYLSATFGFTYLDMHYVVGWPGVIKTVSFTLFMLFLARVVTWLKVRLQF